MNSTKQKRERMSRIMLMHANHREEMQDRSILARLPARWA